MILSILMYTFLFPCVERTASMQLITNTIVNVKEHGAKGDNINDDTQAIINSIKYAKANGIPTVYFPAGTYSIRQLGISTGIIPLLNGVSLKGAGAASCHIKLSGNRYNPNSIFYQAWWDEPSVNNIIIQGIDFDGNLSEQKFATSYQYCHALSINNGKNIEIKNCKFQSFRGDGCLFGDTFLASPNLRITSNVSVHDNVFYNIYREGAMFCCVNGASFYNNYIHGDGYFVGGVDIERHSINETVLNVSVYNNTFDFRDGYGPVERGGPIVKYRRAVTMGFFYAGYKDKIADELAGGHHIYNNKIYQGQIDCWGHTNVFITNNTFNNLLYENIVAVNWLSAPAINISDPGSTNGLRQVTVSGNIINSVMQGNGIFFNNYSDVIAQGNCITGTRSDGINIYWSAGVFENNIIKNIGTPSNKVSGIVINGTCSGLIVSNNTIIDFNAVSKRSINYAIAIQSKNNGAMRPKIEYNMGVNVSNGVVSEFSGQLGFAEIKGNKTKNRLNE
ncbi:right-handed parallel beta-helix repeat-containing protein [Mucilaginibacter sp.]|uniref:right-handed parallel beta-helix repeat-containing protein n=1 Tax=Mucilaginibacter sp. TaxID=1882438 RepID=UPI00260E1513|nr:right-handed parallel beta-helix repeat-containing protein [Mucilaginibacter sp.]MDB4925321.1 hypothetical protein [Mucilaginibacter sp.]